VIAYPRLHADYWTPKHAHRLTVLPSPRYELALLVRTRTTAHAPPHAHDTTRHDALSHMHHVHMWCVPVSCAHQILLCCSPQVKQRHVPGRSVTTFLNGLVKITISLQRTGFYLGEPVSTRHDTTRHDTTRHDTTRHDTTRHTPHDTHTTALTIFSCVSCLARVVSCLVRVVCRYKCKWRWTTTRRWTFTSWW
jgi:hypothetical protein